MISDRERLVRRIVERDASPSRRCFRLDEARERHKSYAVTVANCDLFKNDDLIS